MSFRSAASLTVVLAAGSLAVPTVATATVSTEVAISGQAETSPTEAERVDRVPAPEPDWFDCSFVFLPRNECATVELPLDYDEPYSETTEVAVLRLPAADPERRIGTLFVNPGGPGGSGVIFAAQAQGFLAQELLDRFDVVGIDPRGTNFSANVQCWEDLRDQGPVLTGLNVAFPWTRAEEERYVASSKEFGRACSTTGQPLSGSMSTAEVARDMDVLRRAVGDEKLTYLGFSYGSYLGNVYANQFPDRVRAVAIDGVLDPNAWSGTENGESVPQTTRIGSGESAARSLREILSRCEDAGEEYCEFASTGDPQRNYDKVMRSLQREPLVITDPETGDELFTLTYATFVAFLLGDMYAPDAALFVDLDLSAVYQLLAPPGSESALGPDGSAAARARVLQRVREEQSAEKSARAAEARQRAALGFAFPYDNFFEAYASVLCTDGVNPPDAGDWPAYADRADWRAPDFGRIWTWASAPCASSTWTVRDEDAFTGPFTANTAQPVLVVGSYWDPATRYDGAVTASSLLANSRLLSSDNWGHTAYGTSACATEAVGDYLLTGDLPAEGTVCVGDVQPFTTPLEEMGGLQQRAESADSVRGLPPVVPPLPGSLPRS